VEWLDGVCFEGFGNTDGTPASARVWKAQHFPYWMTSMRHMLPGASDVDLRRQLGELELVTDSVAGLTYLAEAHVCWPSR
jgi:p-hydroxybenzoate 3-monooxygenase